MQIELHPSNERGGADHDWLKTKHSFSFASYMNPDRMGFGELRVINEDFVAPGKGFDTHPHKNMEIVTLVLEGVLEHRDSMGNHGVIRPGEVQRMSAGTGVTHSEFNPSRTEWVHLLQIWVLPKKEDTAPSYDQKSIPPALLKNRLQIVVSGAKRTTVVFINQDAQFLRGDLDAGVRVVHESIRPGHGVFVFLIKGEVKIGDEVLKSGDAAAITEASSIEIKAQEKSQILLIEVPI